MPALAIGAGIAAVGGVAQGLIGANAANNAANLQYQSSQNALNFQKGVFGQQQQNYGNASDYIKSTLSPYINAGYGATNTLSKLTGGGTNTPDYSAFYNSPDYQFAQTQGMKGLTNYENSQGMGLSGGALRDVSTFNQGLATQQYGNYFQRLMQIATLGGNAAGGAASGIGSLTGATNNTYGQMANTVGNTTMAGGQAQASGVVGAANAITGGIGSGINNSLFAAALGNNPSAYKSSGLSGLLGGGGASGGGTGFSLTGTGGPY